MNTLVHDLGAPHLAIYAQQCRAIAFQAMMRAAVAYRLGGKAAFDKIRDPFGHGSFMLTKYPDRLVLCSRLNLTSFVKDNRWIGRQSLIVPRAPPERDIHR
ncbi:MAG: hypothetical protein HKL95_01725 [Phycisphaerae bacterium]|nr:hypothetical protein [Phycisphaerae bacterium]